MIYFLYTALMLFSSHKYLPEAVLEQLLTKPHTPKELLDTLHSKDYSLSRQTLHTILRQLHDGGVVIKRGYTYSPNLRWVVHTKQQLEKPLEKTGFGDVAHIMKMQEGDSITFRFHDPITADHYWWHIFLALDSIHPEDVPLIIYYPHPWFYYANQKSEKEFIQKIGSNHHVYYGIKGDSVGDKLFKKEMSSEKIHINTGVSVGRVGNRHINIQGDFVSEMRLEESHDSQIAKLFSKNDVIKLKDSLPILVKEKRVTRLRIKKDRNLANKIRKQITKDFLIPKGQRLVL